MDIFDLIGPIRTQGTVLCVWSGKEQNTARGVISSSRRGTYWGVLSEHTVPSPVFLCSHVPFFVRTQGTVPCVHSSRYFFIK